MKGPVLQYPVAFGAITVSYNLPGVKSGLKLDGPTLANIFLGKIKTWNDPAIKSLNPGLSLPSIVDHRGPPLGLLGNDQGLHHVPVGRQPGRGSRRSAPTRPSSGRSAPARPRTPGVAAAIKQTAGAIGYVEQAYALENGFTYAAVKNSQGQFVLPTIANTSLAAQGIAVPADLGISTINSPANGAYPIVSQTFLDAYKDPCKDGGASASTASGLKKFLTYAFGDGQKTLGSGSNQLPYAPLPASLAVQGQRAAGHDGLQRRRRSSRRASVEASATTAAGGRSSLRRSPASRLPDQILKWGLTGLAALILLLLAYFFIKLISESSSTFSTFGLSFVFGNDWDPSRSIYHGFALLFGTLVTSAIALVIGVPVAISAALYLTELCPRRARGAAVDARRPAGGRPVGRLRPVGRVRAGAEAAADREVGCQARSRSSRSSAAAPAPYNYFIAGLVLAIMILPIVSAIAREVMATVPAENKEAALALGATRWEMIRMAVLPYSRPGITGGAMLGLGRALGETIAVVVLIGNAPVVGHTSSARAIRWPR